MHHPVILYNLVCSLDEFHRCVCIEDTINFFETNLSIFAGAAKETTKEEKEEDRDASHFGCSAQVPQG
jgi:hypothetical protein